MTSDSFFPVRPDGEELEPRDDERVPDAIWPITAYRLWQVTPDGNLRSLFGDMTWLPGVWMAARCNRSAHSAPREGCTCGIYATKDPRHLPAGCIESRRVVLGRVQFAGKVIEHDDGYRAEHGRVLEIIPLEINHGLSKRVAGRYGVPLGEEAPASILPGVELIVLPPEVVPTRPSAGGKGSGLAPFLWLAFWMASGLASATVSALSGPHPAPLFHRGDTSAAGFWAVVLASTAAVSTYLLFRRWLGGRFSRQQRARALDAAKPPV